MRKSIRPLIALTAALALTVTAGMSALAQADNNEKHFSVIEAASNEDSLTIPEIAKKCGTSVVAIETETKVVYNTYDNDYYNPFGGMFGYGFGYVTGFFFHIIDAGFGQPELGFHFFCPPVSARLEIIPHSQNQRSGTDLYLVT